MMRDNGRLEILILFVLLLASVFVLWKSAHGDFRSMMTFPLVFAVVVVVVVAGSLLSRRGSAMRTRVALGALTVLVALLAPVVQSFHLSAERRVKERRAMQTLGGRPAPAIPYVHAFGADGAPGVRDSFEGRVTLVNFWATWCNPCRKEIPILEKFWKDHRGPGLEVVGVTKLYDGDGAVRDEIARIGEFLADRGASYPNLVCDHDSPAHDAFAVVSLPTSVLIDRRGEVAAMGIGIDGTKSLLARARELLEAGE